MAHGGVRRWIWLGGAALVLAGCGGAAKPAGGNPTAVNPTGGNPTGGNPAVQSGATIAGPASTAASEAASPSPAGAGASVPQAPPGVAQQCVAVEGLLTNATAVITSSGSLNTAADLKTRFDAYGKQLTAAAAGGPATLQTGVAMFVAALNTYAADASTGTNPPPNLLSDAATTLSAACTASP